MKEFKGLLYAIIDKNGNMDYTTLSNLRKESIRNFLKGTSLTWKEAKKYGWKCEKIDVFIQSTNNSDDWK